MVEQLRHDMAKLRDLREKPMLEFIRSDKISEVFDKDDDSAAQ